MEAVAHNPPAQKTRRGFNLSSSSSNAVGHKTRKGFNLIEAAIVLGVVGLVIGGIWVASANFYEDWKITRTVEQISMVANCIRDKASHLDVSSQNNAVYFVRDIGCTTSDMQFNPSTGTGVSYAMAYHDFVSFRFDGNGLFYITFQGMPNKKCNVLLNAVTTKFGNSGEILTRARGHNGSNMVWFTADKFPLSISPQKCYVSAGASFEFSIPRKI